MLEEGESFVNFKNERFVEVKNDGVFIGFAEVVSDGYKALGKKKSVSTLHEVACQLVEKRISNATNEINMWRRTLDVLRKMFGKK